MLKKFFSEGLEWLAWLLAHEVVIYSFAFIVGLLVLSEVLDHLPDLGVVDLPKDVNVHLVLGVVSLVSRERVLVSISIVNKSLQLIECLWILLADLLHVLLSEFDLDLEESGLDTHVGVILLQDWLNLLWGRMIVGNCSFNHDQVVEWGISEG